MPPDNTHISEPQDSGSEDMILHYCRSSMQPNEVAAIVQRVIRICKTQIQKGEEIVHSLSCGTCGQETPELLARFCQSMLTTSNSLNRALYEFESASNLEPVAIAAGKYRKLCAKVDPLERQQIYDSIQIRKAADQVIVYLPFLPGRRQTTRQFIYELLFQRLLDEAPYPKWGRVHILFTHVYPTNLRSFPKDVDNFNYKPAIDFLSAAMAFSDSAWTCSLEKRAEFRDDLATGAYIQISPQAWNSTLEKWNASGSAAGE